MFKGRMKRIGFAHLFGNLLYAGGGNIAAIRRRFDTLGVFFGDIVDHTVVRQDKYQPLFENFINFVACQLHRGDGFGLAAGFLL